MFLKILREAIAVLTATLSQRRILQFRGPRPVA